TQLSQSSATVNNEFGNNTNVININSEYNVSFFESSEEPHG
ncbi:21181_t:CDS:2, partial [Gigaspora rosea]